jgi:hypothetical protein
MRELAELRHFGVKPRASTDDLEGDRPITVARTPHGALSPGPRQLDENETTYPSPGRERHCGSRLRAPTSVVTCTNITTLGIVS